MTTDVTDFNATLEPERRKAALLRLKSLAASAWRERRREDYQAIEDAIFALTEPLDDHDDLFDAEIWEGPCLCRECRSYGDS